MLSYWMGLEFVGGLRLLVKRFSFHWAFVAGTAGLAACLPFMNELMGLIGGGVATQSGFPWRCAVAAFLLVPAGSSC